MEEEIQQLKMSLAAIVAAHNQARAEFNALTGICIVQSLMLLEGQPNISAIVAKWKRGAEKSVEVFESYAGTKEQDEQLRAAMALYVHQYFDDLQASLPN